MTKCVAVVQCEVTHERCTGAQCSVSFAHRKYAFAEHGSEVEFYVPFPCGGCPGRRVGRLATNLIRAMKKEGVEKEEIVVHLSSCMVNDNWHYPPCPHVNDIETMLVRRGLKVVKGSYISRKAQERREKGVYQRGPIE